jgi:nucleoid DNA-binding protein
MVQSTKLDSGGLSNIASKPRGRRLEMRVAFYHERAGVCYEIAMTRRELIEKVCAELPDERELGPRPVAAVIDRVFEAIAGALSDEGRYTHPGFGTFTVKVQPARPGRNPRTGEPIEIAEGRAVAFKPAAELKARIQR